MIVDTMFRPDALWVVLAIGAAGLLIIGTFGRSRVGDGIAQRVLIGGVLLLATLVAYSLIRTSSAAPHAAIA